VLFGAVAKQKYREVKAHADKVVLDSNLIISDGKTWIREEIKNGNGISVEYALLGGIRHRVNSHDHNPTPSEILYAHTMLSTGQSKRFYQGIPGSTESKPKLDTPIFTQASKLRRHRWSTGGKTYQALRIANTGYRGYKAYYDWS
jgi:hypothetical protein